MFYLISIYFFLFLFISFYFFLFLFISFYFFLCKLFWSFMTLFSYFYFRFLYNHYVHFYLFIVFCTKYIHWYFSLIVNWFLTINWYLFYFLEIRYRIKQLVMLIYSETVTSLSLNLIFLLLLILLIFQVDQTNFKLFFPVDFAAFFFSLCARFSLIFSEIIIFHEIYSNFVEHDTCK